RARPARGAAGDAACKAARHLARPRLVRGMRAHRGRKAGLIVAKQGNSETSRKRADVVLVERGLFESRARARAAIDAGLVVANDRQILKASEVIPADAVLQAQPAHPWVSRGGVKLAGALEQYPIEIEDHICL